MHRQSNRIFDDTTRGKHGQRLAWLDGVGNLNTWFREDEFKDFNSVKFDTDLVMDLSKPSGSVDTIADF